MVLAAIKVRFFPSLVISMSVLDVGCIFGILISGVFSLFLYRLL